MERLHAVVHGRVQGVGFRDSTQQEAVDLQLTGWVRNQSDGTVHVVAEGEREQLDLLVAFLGRGPSVARVDSVDLDWQEATGEFARFDIRF